MMAQKAEKKPHFTTRALRDDIPGERKSLGNKQNNDYRKNMEVVITSKVDGKLKDARSLFSDKRA